MSLECGNSYTIEALRSSKSILKYKFEWKESISLKYILNRDKQILGPIFKNEDSEEFKKWYYEEVGIQNIIKKVKITDITFFDTGAILELESDFMTISELLNGTGIEDLVYECSYGEDEDYIYVIDVEDAEDIDEEKIKSYNTYSELYRIAVKGFDRTDMFERADILIDEISHRIVLDGREYTLHIYTDITTFPDEDVAGVYVDVEKILGYLSDDAEDKLHERINELKEKFLSWLRDDEDPDLLEFECCHYEYYEYY